MLFEPAVLADDRAAAPDYPLKMFRTVKGLTEARMTGVPLLLGL
jgi:hypothetical protein